MGKYFSILALMIFVTSCSKEATYEPDTVKPVIKVDYPTDNPVINTGSPLCSKMLVSDNKSPANVWLQINDGSGFKKEYSITGRSLDIIEKYTASPGVSGNLIAKFFATDEAGNMSSEEISFTVNN